MSKRTISFAISLCANTSAQVAPTFPAPTTVTFIDFKLTYYNFDVEINHFSIITKKNEIVLRNFNYSF